MVSPPFRQGPRLALGTVQWGLCYGIANRTGQPTVEEVQHMLDWARGAGIDTLDTARAYGDSEERIGRLVGADPHWTIVTKLSPQVWQLGRSELMTIDATLDDLATSRRCLHRQTLDVVLLHRAEHRTVAKGVIWDTLRREREAGRIRRLGVSSNSPFEAYAALEDPDVEVIQIASSLLDQRLTRSGFLAAARSRGKLVFVRSIFLQGIARVQPRELSGHLVPLTEPLNTIQSWARQRNLPVIHAFLAFARALEATFVLLGCENACQLRQNVEAWKAAGDWAAEIGSLAGSIPDFPETLINPALWPGSLV